MSHIVLLGPFRYFTCQEGQEGYFVKTFTQAFGYKILALSKILKLLCSYLMEDDTNMALFCSSANV